MTPIRPVPRPFIPGLRPMTLLNRFLLLVVIALVPALVIEIYTQLALRRERTAEIAASAERIARLIEDEQAGMVEGVRLALSTLRRTDAVRERDFDACGPVLRAMRRDYPKHLDIHVTDGAGVIRCATEPRSVGMDISARPHVAAARAAGDFAVGEMIVTRVHGRPALGFAMPYLLEDGTVGGFVTALLDLGWLDRYLAEKPLPANAMLLVADRRGALLAARPKPPGAAMLPQGLRPFLHAAQGGTIDLVGADGVERLFAYSPVGDGLDGVFVAVGIDMAAATAPAARAAWLTIAAIGIILALTLAAAALMGRRFVHEPIERLLDAARRWREGDLEARVPATGRRGELEALGAAFNEMAAALQDRARLSEEAHRAEAKMASVLESITDSLFEVDATWRVTFVNENGRALLADGRDVQGLVLWEVFPGGSGADFWNQLQRVMLERAPAGFEAYYPPHGRWYAVRAYPARDGGVAVYVRDVSGRVQALHALRASEARLKAIVDTAVDAIVVIDEAGTILSANHAAERIFGHPAADLQGRNVRMLMPQPDQGAHDGYLSRYMRTGERSIIGVGREVHGLRRDGSTFPLDLSIAEWSAGGQRYFTGIMRDISARRAAEAELQGRTARLKLLADLAGAMLTAETQDEVLRRLLDLAPADLGLDMCVAFSADGGTLALTFAEGIPDEMRGMLARVPLEDESCMCARTARERKPVVLAGIRTSETPAHRIVRALGLGTYAGFPLFDGTGTLIGVIAFGSCRRDAFAAEDLDLLVTVANHVAAVAERLRADAALKESEERLLLALESGNAGTFDWDVRADRMAWSAEYMALVGMEQGHGPSGLDTWIGSILPEDRGRAAAAIREALDARRPEFRMEYRVMHPALGIRWLAAVGRLKLGEDGAPLRLTGLNIDVTDAKSAEAALEAARDEAEQANLSKSKFMAAASHDLRQPLQSMFLLAAALERHLAPEGREVMVHLERGLDALKQLMDSLMDVSKLDAGAVTAEPVEFELADVMDQIDSTFGPVAAGKGLDWRIDRAAGLRVHSDPALLARMLRNIVENAVRYTEAGGVRVACRVEGGRARITVADTGVGIPPDHLGRIWEEFHQVGNEERDRNQGLGLGLAIVQRLSSLLGHPVEVSSTPGRGSVFHIDLPAVAGSRAGAGAAAGAAPRHDAAGRLALLIDDDAIVLLGLQAMFRDWGYEVLAAASGDQALQRVARAGRLPDVVVSDYRLRQGEVGTDAVRRLRAELGVELPAILLTGETGPDCQQEADALGMAVVHKPVTPRQLAAALRACAEPPAALAC